MSTTRSRRPLSLTGLPTFTRRQTLWALGGLGLQITGCGGGDSNIAGISTGGTGSFTSGPILGLGSIIVNGIRYDDSDATVSRLDGDDAVGAFKLGMLVNIAGSEVTGDATLGTATATATRIAYDSEWKGPVGSVGATSFTLLGQTVNVTSTTVWEGVAGLALLSTSHFVEVYGYLDATTASLEATRVEVSVSAPSAYKLSGVVAGRTSQQFSLGGLTIDLTNQTDYSDGLSASTLSDGMAVRVRLSTTLNAGRGVALRVKTPDNVASSLLIEDDDDRQVELKGTVTAIIGNRFAVNGVTVNADALGGVSGLGLTRWSVVEVKGSIAGGVVTATRVQQESEEDRESLEFELHGTINSFTAGSSAQSGTFQVRGYEIDYGNTTNIQVEGAPWPSLLSIEVKAQYENGRWVARKIEAEIDD
jgi:Domain of unknown function (DUF5666)